MDTIEELIEQRKVRVGTNYRTMTNGRPRWELRFNIELDLLRSLYPDVEYEYNEYTVNEEVFIPLFIDLIRRKKRKRVKK